MASRSMACQMALRTRTSLSAGGVFGARPELSNCQKLIRMAGTITISAGFTLIHGCNLIGQNAADVNSAGDQFGDAGGLLGIKRMVILGNLGYPLSQ